MKFTKQTIHEFTVPMNTLMKDILPQPESDNLVVAELDKLKLEGKTDTIQYAGGHVSVRLWADLQTASDWQTFVTALVPIQYVESMQIQDINTD